jgi:hypothetical protein
MTDDDNWMDQAVVIQPQRELSDEEIESATLEELRAAYRALRNSHRWRVFKYR